MRIWRYQPAVVVATALMVFPAAFTAVFAEQGTAPSSRGRESASLFKEILFRATYDEDVNADLHKGNPVGTAEGSVVFEDGAFGKAVVVGDAFARLVYTVGSHSHPLNLSCREGGLSFHFKAVDWAPSEKRSHLFFRVKSAALLRVFTDGEGMLVFETGSDVAQRNGVKASLADKKKGEWIHVVATWSRKEIRLYLDGKLAARKDNEDRYLSYAHNTTFEVGDIPRGMGREGTRKTLIDDLTIFRRPLGDDELFRVEKPKSAGSAQEYGPPVLVIPRAKKSPVMDGVFSREEWEVAAELVNFSSVSDHKLAPVQTRAYVTYDDANVYVAVRSPVLPGVPLAVDCTMRDDNVWQDDATQIYLTVPSGNRFLFIGNSIGTIFDRKYQKGIKSDVTWNGDWKYGTDVADGVWTAEVSLSFEEMEVKPPAEGETWRLNVTRDRAEPQNLSAWPTLSGYADTPKHGYLTFAGAAPVVTSAPSCEGIMGPTVKVAATLCGAAITETTTVELEWIAASAGVILLAEREEITLEPAAQAHAALERTFGAAPDSFTFTARDKKADRVVYRQTVSFSSREAIALSFSPIPSKGVCRISLNLGGAGVRALGPSAQIDILPRGSETPVATLRIEKFTDGRGGVQFDLDELDAGTYDVRTQLAAHGEVLATKTDAFTKPDESWRGNTLGVSDTPPPPWTPIETETSDQRDLTVRCWNREHFFAGAPLPAQITNGGADVLAGPVQLVATLAGKTQQWIPGHLTVTSTDKNKVVFKTVQTSDALALDAETAMEFDGMLWTEITVTPKGKAQLDALDLVIPIKNEYAKYRHWPSDVALTGNIGRENGWRWEHDLPNYAYFWIGNDDVGLTWFFETWRQFRFADEESKVELVREDGALRLLIHYVGTPVSFEEPLTLAFGLQATPTRPRTRGWRSRGGGNIIGVNVEEFGRSEELHRYGSGYPEAANPDYYSRFVKARHDDGSKATPYVGILWSPNFSPEMQYNVADWDLGGGINKYSDQRKFWWGRRICGASASYTEFFTWKGRAFIEDMNLDGLYHDLQWSYRCGNPNHGYAETHRSIRGDRELNKRIYAMMKGFERPVFKWDHASNLICSLTSPFSDMFLTGEEMRRYPPAGEHPDYKVRGNYFHNMRLDYFKACGATGRQWGVAPMFLTQITQSSPDCMDALYAILLAHDAIPIGEALWRDVRYMRRLLRTLEEFGIGEDDVEFLPYWHETTPASVIFTPEGGGAIRPFQVEYDVPEESKLLPEEAIGASIYRRNGKRSLVIVFNYTQDDGVASLRIDFRKLGLSGPGLLAADALSRLVWTRASSELTIPVNSLSYRLIWLEALDENGLAGARIIDAFPAPPEEKMLAGFHPGNPFGDKTGMEFVGDYRKAPWRNGDASFTGPQRTDLAQTFTVHRPSTVHRIEAYLRDSEGAFAIRKSVQVSIVRLGEDGLPSDSEVLSAEAFAPTWADSRRWRYDGFELKRSAKLEPGRYALVFSKLPEEPGEFYHARFVAAAAEELPGECVAARETPARGATGVMWKRDTDKVICFGVYGYEAPQAD